MPWEDQSALTRIRKMQVTGHLSYLIHFATACLLSCGVGSRTLKIFLLSVAQHVCRWLNCLTLICQSVSRMGSFCFMTANLMDDLFCSLISPRLSSWKVDE